MKILNVDDLIEEYENDQDVWTVTETVLGPAMVPQYVHIHKFPKMALEWRVAEYDMDPKDHDAVLHLILHEVTLHRRTEVNCWTPGYDQHGALQARLAQIQVNIDRHAARMDAGHHRMAKHAPHKHPALDPIRELGIRDEVLHPRRLFVEGLRAKKDGRRSYASGKLQEAHALLAQETSPAIARP